MKDIERVLIVGAGAVGTAFASIIHNAEPGKVFILAEGERFERYSREGFTINGKRYDFPLVASGETAARIPFDLIIVAVKHHHLDEAIAQMRPFVGAETTILSLLNGITSEEILGAAFGRMPPYAMVLGIDAVRVGNDTRFASSGKIFFGEVQNVPGSFSPRVDRIVRYFERVGVPYSVPENMLRTLWFKFMINVGINQASALLRAPYRLFQTCQEARRPMLALMREVIAVSRAKGIGLDDSDLANWEATLAKLHGDNLTSMCQDVIAGRKTEVEIFAGTVTALGRECGVPTPVNDLFFDLIRAMEAGFGINTL